MVFTIRQQRQMMQQAEMDPKSVPTMVGVIANKWSS